VRRSSWRRHSQSRRPARGCQALPRHAHASCVIACTGCPSQLRALLRPAASSAPSAAPPLGPHGPMRAMHRCVSGQHALKYNIIPALALTMLAWSDELEGAHSKSALALIMLARSDEVEGAHPTADVTPLSGRNGRTWDDGGEPHAPSLSQQASPFRPCAWRPLEGCFSGQGCPSLEQSLPLPTPALGHCA
jgi:hypothetical protein